MGKSMRNLATVVSAVLFYCAAAMFMQSAAALEVPKASLSSTDQALLKRMRSAVDGSVTRPVVKGGGEVAFIFGASDPTVVCSILHVCDLALQAGEKVVDIKSGDSSRWLIERSASGSSAGVVEHVTVKPTDVGLATNLRIYTDRRSYSINLKSDLMAYMPSVSFIYPEAGSADAGSKSSAAEMLRKEERAERSHASRREVSPDELDFDYEISGDDPLKPLRVFNDGRQTFVQLREELLREGGMPALVAVSDAGFFEDDGISVLNYRLRNNSFVVDGVPSHLRLLSGRGGVAGACDIVRAAR